MDFKTFSGKYLAELRRCIEDLSVEGLGRVAEMIRESHGEETQIFIIGNGGSAATASHFACDLGKGCSKPGRKRFRVMSLCDNVSWMTALGNDLSYDDLFVEQLKNYLRPGDLLIAITGSGNSSNILKAVEYARGAGARTVGLIGFGGGKLKGMVDVDVTLPSKHYGPVEDMHLVMEHLLSYYLKENL